MSLPFRDFQQLYNRGDYSLVTLRGDSHAEYLKQAGEETYQHRVWASRMMGGEGLANTAQEGFEIISKPGNKVSFYCNALHARYMV